jgi:hypothetical protein
MKKLANLKDVKTLGKKEQKSIIGSGGLIGCPPGFSAEECQSDSDCDTHQYCDICTEKCLSI